MSEDADEGEAETSILEAIYADQLVLTSQFEGQLELPLILASTLKLETQD